MKLPLQTKIFLAICVSLGFLALFQEALFFNTPHPLELAAYITLAAASGLFKIRVPGVTGNMSISFLFILLAIPDLSRGEALLVGPPMVLIQSYYRAQQRVRIVQLAFNVAMIVTASFLAYQAFHAVAFVRFIPLPAFG